jgi:hypothetical protein
MIVRSPQRRRSHLISMQGFCVDCGALDQQQRPVAAEKQRLAACLCTSAAICLFTLIRGVPYDACPA